MRRAAVVTLLVLAGGTAGAAGPGDGSQQRFEAATALEARGDYANAAAALEKLGHDSPDDSFAADALYEAAVVAEERLADPARARRLYEEVAARYPTTRLWRRARTRADFLAHSLTTGEGPLREYDAVLQNATRDPATARTRMERLLAEHPEFALADRALYWLGQSYAQARDEKRAMEKFEETERRFPASEWAGRAKKARGDLLLGRGHPLAARALFKQLLEAGDPLARSAGREGLADVNSWWLRGAAAVGSALYLLAFVVLQVRTVRPRRKLWALPQEVGFYAPVAGLFVAAGLTENKVVAWAIALIATAGAVVVWVSTAGATARLERGPMATSERMWRSLAAATAVLAVMVLAVQVTGLTDLVLETLRAGPERN
jgi:TolA-binding protein